MKLPPNICSDRSQSCLHCVCIVTLQDSETRIITTLAASIFSIVENFSEESDHFSERQVCCFRIETRAFIACKCVLGWIQKRFVADTGVFQRAIDRFAPSLGNV